MRVLASRLSTYLCRRRSEHVQSHNFSSHNAEAEIFIKAKRIRWVLNAVTATYLGYLFGFPFMDERRMKAVEIDGAQELVNTLADAEDYYTRIEALKALDALSGSDEEAAVALHRAGVISVIQSTPQSSDGAILFLGSTPESCEAEIRKYKSSLLNRF